MKESHKKIICTDTFKNSDSQRRKKEFNEKWISIINQKEKNKLYNEFTK